MTDFGKKYLKSLDDKSLTHILYLLSAAAIATIIYGLVFSGFQIVDEFEHLHASWLVGSGKVPYRDFFEHHHPLLWFLTAPIVLSFFDNISIFYVMRGISFVISCATLFYCYKIARFWASKNGALFTVVSILANLITAYNFYQFRPDVYMNFTFIFGLYYWLKYMGNHKLSSLITSFIGFALSLLFLQKITPLLGVVEIIFVILLIQKKIKLRDVFLASLPAVALGLLFFGYLYSNGAFLDYFNFNYRFNKAMLFYFDRGAFWISNIAFGIYGIAFITALLFFKKGSSTFRIVSILYIAEFLMRVFYFSPHPNYYTLLTFLAGIILALWIDKLMPKHKIGIVIILCALFLNVKGVLETLDKSTENYNSFKYYKMVQYIHANSEPNDYLMNGYDKNFNIYRKDVSFYWFGLDMLLPIIEKEFGIENKIDVNELVVKYKPKFFYAVNYPDLQAYRTYGEHKYSQVFLPFLIEEFYTETPFKNLVTLK